MAIEYSLGTSQVMREMKQEAIRLGLARSHLPSTGSYSLDLNLNKTPEKVMILITGPSGSGKTFIANVIKNCFKNCILIDQFFAEDRKIEDFRGLLHSGENDCVIVTFQTRRASYGSDEACPTRLLSCADYVFSVSKIENGAVKVRCTKNRYRRSGDEFYLDLFLNMGKLAIEEI